MDFGCFGTYVRVCTRHSLVHLHCRSGSVCEGVKDVVMHQTRLGKIRLYGAESGDSNMVCLVHANNGNTRRRGDAGVARRYRY